MVLWCVLVHSLRGSVACGDRSPLRGFVVGSLCIVLIAASLGSQDRSARGSSCVAFDGFLDGISLRKLPAWVVYGFYVHTSESDWICSVIGPKGVESLEPASPVGGRNLIKASHWHSSPPRSHLVHTGRISSPTIALGPADTIWLMAITGKASYIHFLRFRRQFRHPDRVRRRFWPVVAEASSDILCR